jgi:DNA-binding NtrC family response regulator
MNQPLVIVGHNVVMRRIAQEISAASASEVPVLISGESGVGRRLIARTIHGRSARHDGPFVPVNCACLPESRLEAELFGHAGDGATDARSEMRGRLDAASHGTIVLREVGCLTERLQGRLLRFMETKEVQRVGSVRVVPTDVRLISITRRRLAHAVADNRFRADLFYRMNVIHIEVPPLRERRDDVPALFRYFMCIHAARLGRPVASLTPDALGCLADYDWPGNVRELKAVAEQLVLTREPGGGGVDALRTEILRRSSWRIGARLSPPPVSPYSDRVRLVPDARAAGV